MVARLTALAGNFPKSALVPCSYLIEQWGWDGDSVGDSDNFTSSDVVTLQNNILATVHSLPTLSCGGGLEKIVGNDSPASW